MRVVRAEIAMNAAAVLRDIEQERTRAPCARRWRSEYSRASCCYSQAASGFRSMHTSHSRMKSVRQAGRVPATARGTKKCCRGRLRSDSSLLTAADSTRHFKLYTVSGYSKFEKWIAGRAFSTSVWQRCIICAEYL